MKAITIALAATLMTTPALADNEMMTITKPSLACGDQFMLRVMNDHLDKLYAKGKQGEINATINSLIDNGVCHPLRPGDHLYFVQKNPDINMSVGWMPVGAMKFALWVFTDTYTIEGN